MVREYKRHQKEREIWLNLGVVGGQWKRYRALRREPVYQSVRNGDLVDFGGYGQLYVVDGADPDRFWDYPHSFWVTRRKADRHNPDALGHFIEKTEAKEIIEEG